MNLLTPMFVIPSGVALFAIGLSLLALWLTRSIWSTAEEHARLAQAQYASEIENLRASVDGLAAKLGEVQQQQHSAVVVPTLPKPGFNLNKRSQALRLRRMGSSTEQIVVALDVTTQEVELLLKVHRIVIANL